MSDVVERAKVALEGVTPGPWVHCTAPHPEEVSHAEWLDGTLIGEGEPLHVITAASPDPKFAYIVPAVTGDGPTSAINAEFIAAAPDLVRELVAEVERLRPFSRCPGCGSIHTSAVLHEGTPSIVCHDCGCGS